MKPRLSNETIGALGRDVARPGYDRASVTPGIVHIGVGAFHRAHQAAYVDECLAAGQTDWGIVAASLRSSETRDALQPQDGLYMLAIRSDAKETLRVIGSILDIAVAPENPASLIATLADPAIRIVTLTVTEKAYLRNPEGGLDLDHPDIRADIADPRHPRTIYGFITEALVQRRAAGHSPFTILSCDNLPANGRTLHRLLIAVAGRRSAELADFIRNDVACPSSMVDRIVPATTAQDRIRIADATGMADAWPVVTEPFCQWVIEDRFPQGRPDWERFGVTMVEDVTPFETMKLRLLNGAHSALAYLGQLLGLPTVADAFANPPVRQFVDELWAELIPTLPAVKGLGSEDYTVQLAARFSNRALKHLTAQIANDGSQKLPQRVIEAAIERLSAGLPVDHLAFVVAAWIAALETRGQEKAFSDPLDTQLAAMDLGSMHHHAKVETIFEITGFAKAAQERDALVERVAAHLTSIHTYGVEQTLMILCKGIAK